MKRGVIAACLCGIILGGIPACQSVQDDISFNHHIKNRGDRPIAETLELSGPGAAETQLNRVDERIENAFY